MNLLEKQNGQDFSTAFCGFFMGAADVVPGVSGGTVALILGIYERLVTAISRIDLRWFELLRRGQWRPAAAHVDLRFLIALLVGIAGGFLAMTMLMNRLLTDPVARSLTLAAFFGLILGSALMVSGSIRVASNGQLLRCLLTGIAGAAFAFWLITLGNVPQHPSYAYLFFCASVAICAMILPGISGAMILVILGVYEHLTEIPGNLLHGRHVAEGLITIAVFVSGAGISLMLFSRVLRWLLKHYHAVTMALLCGFMFGSLPKLWPFQRDLTPEIPAIKSKRFQPIWPETLDGQVLGALAIAVAMVVLVLVIDRMGRAKRESRAPSDMQ
jgi:putative membrane protein